MAKALAAADVKLQMVRPSMDRRYQAINQSCRVVRSGSGKQHSSRSGQLPHAADTNTSQGQLMILALSERQAVLEELLRK
eukprot:SAG31_NODE_35176_length_325_cov_1.146018_1_plen_79_part_01